MQRSKFKQEKKLKEILFSFTLVCSAGFALLGLLATINV